MQQGLLFGSDPEEGKKPTSRASRTNRSSKTRSSVPSAKEGGAERLITPPSSSGRSSAGSNGLLIAPKQEVAQTGSKTGSQAESPNRATAKKRRAAKSTAPSTSPLACQESGLATPIAHAEKLTPEEILKRFVWKKHRETYDQEYAENCSLWVAQGCRPFLIRIPPPISIDPVPFIWVDTEGGRAIPAWYCTPLVFAFAFHSYLNFRSRGSEEECNALELRANRLREAAQVRYSQLSLDEAVAQIQRGDLPKFAELTPCPDFLEIW